ncbi:MAG: hypothetical protein AAB037_00705, partial [Chloroflexota bacterium]
NYFTHPMTLFGFGGHCQDGLLRRPSREGLLTMTVTLLPFHWKTESRFGACGGLRFTSPTPTTLDSDLRRNGFMGRFADGRVGKPDLQLVGRY